MNLADQVSELTAKVRRLEKREPPLAATFIDTATDPADDVRVIAPGWDDGEHAFGPVRWSPIGGALPQAGDEAVIVERDDGVWQVVAWWSDSQGTGVAQSVIDALDTRLDAVESVIDALDTRLDALEAIRTVSGSVAANGTESSPAFSVTKNGTGDYTVTFTTAFTATPDVIPGVGPSSTFHYAKLHASTPPSTTAFRIICLAIDGGAALDGAFTFIARGT